MCVRKFTTPVLSFAVLRASYLFSNNYPYTTLTQPLLAPVCMREHRLQAASVEGVTAQ